jgi:hypothetical protein
VRHEPDPSWTVPLHVMMWTVLALGAIGLVVITLMHF